MKLLHDLLFTDYGLMSLIGFVFMLGMGVFFSALIFIRRKDSSISFAYLAPVIPIGRSKLKSSGPQKSGFAFFTIQRAF